MRFRFRETNDDDDDDQDRLKEEMLQLFSVFFRLDNDHSSCAFPPPPYQSINGTGSIIV